MPQRNTNARNNLLERFNVLPLEQILAMRIKKGSSHARMVGDLNAYEALINRIECRYAEGAPKEFMARLTQSERYVYHSHILNMGILGDGLGQPLENCEERDAVIKFLSRAGGKRISAILRKAGKTLRDVPEKLDSEYYNEVEKNPFEKLILDYVEKHQKEFAAPPESFLETDKDRKLIKEHNKRELQSMEESLVRLREIAIVHNRAGLIGLVKAGRMDEAVKKYRKIMDCSAQEAERALTKMK